MHTGTNIHIRAAASLALLLLASSAFSKVYKCKDADGNVTFSDKWCAEVSMEATLVSDDPPAKVEAKPAPYKRASAYDLATEGKAQERKRACELDRSSNKCDGSP